MSNGQEHDLTSRVPSRKKPGGWQIDLGDASWADMMTALALAIDVCDRDGLPAAQERAARFRALRTSRSKVTL